MTFIDRDLADAPSSPAEGDTYLIAASGTTPGDPWETHNDQVAFYYSGWIFKAPRDGFIAYVVDEDIVLVYDASTTTWDTVGGGGGGGAPTSASYICVANEGALTEERRLAGQTGQITLVDDGPDDVITINIADDPIMPGTGAMRVPDGTSGEEPTGGNGDIRYNVTTDKFRVFENGAWIDLVGAVSTGVPIRAYKTTNEAITTTPLQNDNHLSFVCEANSKYLFEMELRISISDISGANGIKTDFDDTSGVMVVNRFDAFLTSPLGALVGLEETSFNALNDGKEIPMSDTAEHRWQVAGHIDVGATGGTLQWRWSLRVGLGTLQVRRGSWLMAVKI